MKNRPHTTSMLLGAVFGALVIFTMGARPKGEQAPPAEATEPPAGRFAIACTENHAIVLDTQTGETWSQIFNSTYVKNSSNFFKVKTGEGE